VGRRLSWTARARPPVERLEHHRQRVHRHLGQCEKGGHLERDVAGQRHEHEAHVAVAGQQRDGQRRHGAEAAKREPAEALQQQIEHECHRDREQRVARALERERGDPVHDRKGEQEEIRHRKPVDRVAPARERCIRDYAPDDRRDEERAADQGTKTQHEVPHADRELQVEERQRERRQREWHERRRHDDDHCRERRVEAHEQRDRDAGHDRRRGCHQDERFAQLRGKAECLRRRRERPDDDRRHAQHENDEHGDETGPATEARHRRPVEAHERQREGNHQGRRQQRLRQRGERRRGKAHEHARRHELRGVPADERQRTSEQVLHGYAATARSPPQEWAGAGRRQGGAARPASYMALNRCANVRLTASVSSRPLRTITGSPRQSRSTRAIARRFTIALRWICQNAS
jgi:hypothetical protein